MDKNEELLRKLEANLPRLAIAEEKLQKAIEFVQGLDRSKKPLTTEQRLEAHQQDPNSVSSWEEVKKRFL